MKFHTAQALIAADKHRFRVARCGRRFGKALDSKTLILTSIGYKKLVDIKTGDMVFSEKGKQVKVLHKSEIYTGRKCYEIVFSDGTSIVADASHDWVVEDKAFRKNTARSKVTSKRLKKMTTEEMIPLLFIHRKDGKLETNFSIPVTEAVVFNKATLLIEPYFLGQWLGDGTSTSSDITTIDDETVQYLHEYAARRDERVSRHTQNGTLACSYTICGDRTQKSRNASLQATLRRIGLLGNKHIPDIYKFSSYEQRLSLLRGLMDSDGGIRDGFCEFTSIHKRLAEDVIELLWSFGIKATIHESNATLYGRTVGRKYRIHFSTNISVFSLLRKKKMERTVRKSDTTRRFIVAINPVKSRPVQCLTVDNPTHLFLAGKQLVPTHNSWLAAYEMYALALSTNDARIVYYAPTRDDARDIMWRILKEVCSTSIIGDPNESRLEINIATVHGGRSLIILYGWEALQERGKGVGVKNHFAVLDEVSKFTDFKYGWQEILRPTLMDVQGGALFISTTNGFNHFYDLCNAELNDTDYKTFHFTSYDNPFLLVEEIEKMKMEMSEERAAQEIYAEFRKKEGLVYKEFSRERHVTQEVPQAVIETLGGVDPGFTHPAAIITIKKDYEGNYWVTDEFLQTQKTEAEVVEIVASKRFNRVYPDPENASLAESLKRRGLNVRSVNKGKGSVLSGINIIHNLLKENKIKIHASCINTIQAFEMYSYRETKGDRTPDEMPAHDFSDMLDAFRYVVSMDANTTAINGPRVHYTNNSAYGRTNNLSTVLKKFNT
jgi:PBSX family phage terminase large subunit